MRVKARPRPPAGALQPRRVQPPPGVQLRGHGVCEGVVVTSGEAAAAPAPALQPPVPRLDTVVITRAR